MADYSTPEERTELPTERRMSQMRREGQIFFSSEVAQVTTMTVSFLIICRIVPSLFRGLQEIFRITLGNLSATAELSPNDVGRWLLWAFWYTSPLLLFLFVTNSIVATLSVMLQTKWNIKRPIIRFRIGMLNPIGGIRKIFSPIGLFNTLKALGKLLLVGPIAFFAIKASTKDAIMLPFRGIQGLLNATGDGISLVFWRMLGVFMAFAAVDYVYGKFRWHRQSNMTKQEVKEDQKAQEGDEATKKKMIGKARNRLYQKLASTVPTADVVVTNPTHYAVALRYDREKMGAPEVVAKGTGYLALRIRELAREAGVPILERKLLARSLYASVKVGQQIPAELYRAVAEVLGYVYRLKRGTPEG